MSFIKHTGLTLVLIICLGLNMSCLQQDLFNKNQDINNENDGRTTMISDDTVEGDLSLFSSFDEIDKTEYIEKYGQNSLLEHPVTAAVELIARVNFNPAILEKGNLNPGDELIVDSFGNTRYIAVIDSVTEQNSSYIISGKITGTDTGYISLSFTENLGLGKIEIAELNATYLIRYKHASQSHYLYKAPTDEIEKPIH